jgi:predicted nucleic acid-binding protein
VETPWLRAKAPRLLASSSSNGVKKTRRWMSTSKEASRETVLAAAHVKARFPLSYADAFVVAAAQHNGAVIVTGDPEFAAVESVPRVEWLRVA